MAREAVDTLAASGAVDSSQVQASTGRDGSMHQEGGRDDGQPSQHPTDRSASARESFADTLHQDDAAVVARLDRHTRVEVAVQSDGGVDVTLEAPVSELHRYDGLEDELRSALHQGESDLAGYRTRSGEEDGSQPGEGRRPMTGPDVVSTDSPDSKRETTKVKRGALLDILA